MADARNKKPGKLVKIVLERTIPTLGVPGMTVEVPEAVAAQLCAIRKVHNGTALVSTRSARPFNEAKDSATVGDMSVSEMRQAGLKNVVETPEKFKGPSPAAQNFLKDEPKAAKTAKEKKPSKKGAEKGAEKGSKKDKKMNGQAGEAQAKGEESQEQHAS